jgi:hypothetical protein
MTLTLGYLAIFFLSGLVVGAKVQRWLLSRGSKEAIEDDITYEPLPCGRDDHSHINYRGI